MRIGEFARRAGVTPSAIRFYEKQGLLPRPQRLANGYRSYDAADLRVVTLVHEARTLGFSLADVARFMRRPPEERHDKANLRPALETKLARLDQHLAHILRQREAILAFLGRIGGDETHPPSSFPPAAELAP